MEKTGKPIVAGVINIVTGVISLFALLGLIILIIAFTSPQFFADYAPELFSYEVAIINAILIVVAVFTGIIGILALLSGIYALQRKKWGLALAGSITSILAILPLGIASTILIGMSKDEFD